MMERILKIRDLLADQRNVAFAVFLVIALSITWSTINQIKLNYELEQEASTLRAEIELLEIQNKTKVLENEFLATEYAQELAARRQLGLVSPGEQVLLIPQSKLDDEVQAFDSYRRQLGLVDEQSSPEPELSNLEQWVRFFRGER
ncbi:MAG: hypothetical protein AAF413_02600 [Patescibacteria group bacterium]